MLAAALCCALVLSGATWLVVRSQSCQPADLPDGTSYGANISTAGITAEASMAQVDEAFGRVPIVRTFDPGMPLPWDAPRNQTVTGRDVVTSFRPMPQEVLSGSFDETFRAWFEQAPSDQTIYWSYIHEPEPLLDEGRFTQEQYFAAWEHLAEIAQSACRTNLHATLILTEFTASSPDRDYRDYDPGPEIIEVIAWDPYNGVFDPDRTFYQDPKSLLGPVVDIMEADGRPWGIAEVGSRLVAGDDGQRRAQWLTELGGYAETHDARFVLYFQSTRGANWRLDDPSSRRAWSEKVAERR